MKIIRHGDVLLKQIDKIPNNAKKLKDKVLAYGEVTGHSHRFEKPENIDRYENDSKIYLQVRFPTPLIHEEHNPLIIPVGDYQQIEEREYDYIDESTRAVVD